MSKQSVAKEKQGYEEKPVLPICSNCGYFKSEFDKPYTGSNYVREFNLKCTLGGFTCKKTATCDRYIWNMNCA